MNRSFARFCMLAGLGATLLSTSTASAATDDGLASLRPDAKAALIVVDVQKCFVAGGSLPVKGGEEVVPVINRIARGFDNVVVTQDWHTPHHASFASSHPGRAPFSSIEMPYGPQVLWPDHCVQGTDDAALVGGLRLPNAQLIIRKGFHRDIDSYSAFMEADHRTSTGLAAYLAARGIETVVVVGLATDFCVAWTAIDASRAGFRTVVVEDATRAIDLDGSLDAAWRQMKEAHVVRIHSTQLVIDRLGD